MAKTTKMTARPKRTKAEIEEEFSQIRDEVEEAREGARPKVEEQLKLREAEVRQAVDGLSVESVVSRMSGLGLEVSKALAQFSDQLVQEVNRLAAARDAVALEQKEIERVHKIRCGSYGTGSTRAGLQPTEGATRGRNRGTASHLAGGD